MNWKIILNPFEKHSEKNLLFFGSIMTFLGSFIAYLTKARFDGVIDMHVVDQIRFLEPLFNNLLNTLSLFLLFFLLGKRINSKTRWIDILSVSIISRIPFYVLPLFNIEGLLANITEKLLSGIDFQNLSKPPVIKFSDMLILLVFTAVAVLCFAWFIALFWNGFRVATNTKGTKNIIFFIAFLLLSEVLSKILISTINFH